MKKIKVNKSLGVIFFIIVMIWIGSYSNLENTELKSYWENGHVELSNEDHEKSGVVRLAGNWEHYPNFRWLPGSEMPVESEYLKVPTMGKEMKKSLNATFGTSTYRLKISGLKKGQIYGIRTNVIKMANEFYADEKLIGKSGVVSDVKEEYIPKSLPYVAYFQAEDTDVVLTAVVSNYDYITGGGISNHVFFGDYRGIDRLNLKLRCWDVFQFAGFLVLGFYFIVLYFSMGREVVEERYLLFLGLFSIFEAIHLTTQYTKLIYQFVPDVNYGVFAFIQRMVFPVEMFFLIKYTRYLLPKYIKKYAETLSIVWGVLLGAAILMLPMSSHSGIADQLAMAIFINGLFFAIKAFVQAIYRGEEGFEFFAVSILSLIIYAVMGHLNIHHGTMYSMGITLLPICFIVSQGAYHGYEQKKRRLKIEKMGQRLIETANIKDRFIEEAIHVFKWPVESIQHIIEPIVEEGCEGRLKLVHAISMRLSTLINDVDDFVQLSLKRIEFKNNQVDLDEELLMANKMIEPLYAGEGEVVICERSCDCALIKTDAARIQQILYNVLEFAYSNKDSKEIKVNIRPCDDSVKLEVSFKGRKENLLSYRTVFLDDYHKLGNGLGINVARRIISMQDGDLWIDIHGDLVMVNLTFPALKEENPMHIGVEDKAETQKTANSKEANGHIDEKEKRGSVLFICDDILESQMTKSVLEAKGYGVTTMTVKEATGKETSYFTRYHLVFIGDIQSRSQIFMISKRIRQEYCLLEMPILSMVSKHNPVEEIEVLKSGANMIIPRKCDVKTLYMNIESLIMLKKSFDGYIDMERAYLDAQIKPHFLFNALNTIIGISYEDMETARELIGELSTLLRGHFKGKLERKTIPLEEELEMVDSYLNIEKARFSERLSVVMDIEPSGGFYIPPMTIQTIVENSIKHGFKNKTEDCSIVIKGSCSKDRYRIEVVDNGEGFSDDVLNRVLEGSYDGMGIGLKNVNNRLRSFNQPKLSIYSQVGKGSTVAINILKSECV